MNPMNAYRNNVAVNAHYWGFFFEIPDMLVDFPESDKKLNLRSLPSLDFENNIAYNYRHGGLLILRPAVYDDSLHSSELVISNFSALSSPIKSDYHFGTLVSGSNVLVSNSTMINNKNGIHLRGDDNKVLNSVIIFEKNKIPDKDISGIVIAGGNNLIENSKIDGYAQKNNFHASDISLSNNKNNQRIWLNCKSNYSRQ